MFEQQCYRSLVFPATPPRQDGMGYLIGSLVKFFVGGLMPIGVDRYPVPIPFYLLLEPIRDGLLNILLFELEKGACRVEAFVPNGLLLRGKNPRGQPNIDFQRFKAARENTQSEVDSLAAELTQLDESGQLSASALMPCPFSTRGFQRASTTLRLAVRSNFQEDIEGTLYKYVREETSDPVLTGN